MPCILLCEPFSFEHMAQVGIAVGTYYFYTVAIAVGYMFYRARQFIIKRWPSAMGVEFIGGAVEWSIAAAAYIGAGVFLIGVLTGKRALGTLVYYYPFLFRRELVPFHSIAFKYIKIRLKTMTAVRVPLRCVLPDAHTPGILSHTQDFPYILMQQ